MVGLIVGGGNKGATVGHAPPSDTITAVDRASLRRFIDALTAVGVWHRARGDHVDFRCPLPGHADRDPSGSADWRSGALYLLCHTCGSSATPAIVSQLGLSWAELFDQGRTGDSARQKRSAPRPPRRVQGKAQPPPRERGRLVAVYPYADAEGAVVAECLRYALRALSGALKPRKRFVWRHRPPVGHGCERCQGPWCYRTPAGGLPLYRLPEVLATARAGGHVWVVEGEYNAEDLVAAGAVATTAPCGSSRPWREEYSAALAGARVSVVADRDPPGYARAVQVYRALESTVAAVRVVRTPVEVLGADASDHLAAGLPARAFEVVPVGVLEMLHKSLSA